MQLFTVQGHVIYAIKNNFFIFFFLKSIEMAYLLGQWNEHILYFHWQVPLFIATTAHRSFGALNYSHMMV